MARVLFVTLCESGPEGRDVRRPAPLVEVAMLAEATPEEVAEVAEIFRAPGLSLLTPAAGPLSPYTVLDISHESLIRQWHRLRDWMDREADSARTYRRIEETARLWAEGKAGLWGPTDLRPARDWKREQRPNAAWARRYGGDFDLAMRFLDESERADRISRRKEGLFGGVFGAVLFACTLAVGAYLLNLGWRYFREFFFSPP